MSTKKNLQVYIGSQNYPSETGDEYDYAVGDIPDALLRKVCTKYYMKELYQAANPFQYEQEQDKVVYNPNFRHINPSFFKPSKMEKLDAERICKLTTWTPDKMLVDNWMSVPDDLKVTPYDRIDLLFDAGFQYDEKICKCKDVYIGIYNIHPEEEPV